MLVRSDVLVIKKKDDFVDVNKFCEDYCLNYSYEREMREKGYSFQPKYKYRICDWQFQASEYEQKIIRKMNQRIDYLILCAYDDTKLKNALHHIMPKVEFEDFPTNRYYPSGCFNAWRKAYRISYEDFILNNKYIVFSGNLFWRNAPFYKLDMKKMIDEDVIELIDDGR